MITTKSTSLKIFHILITEMYDKRIQKLIILLKLMNEKSHLVKEIK